LTIILILVIATGSATGVWLWQRSGLFKPGSDPSKESAESLPKAGSERYEEYADAFQLGVVALDVGMSDNTAETNLTKAIELIPGEPAGWANRGLFYLRNGQLDKAAEDLEKARKLAPDNVDVEVLSGLLAERRGEFEQSIKFLRRAVERDPANVVVLFRLSRNLQIEGGPDIDAENQKLMEQILKVQPNNLLALVERAKTAARQGDTVAVRDSLARLKKLSESWSPESRKELDKVEKQAAGNAKADVLLLLTQFGFLLNREPLFVLDRNFLNPRDEQLRVSLQNFLRLQPLLASPAPPDRAVTFTPEPLVKDRLSAEIPGKHWNVALPVWLNSNEPPITLVANPQQVVRTDGKSLTFPFPGGSAKVPPSRAGIVPLDWNGDYRMDLLLAGAGGLRFLQQQPDGSFKDVTGQTKLPEMVVKADYYGAWAVDIDMDGDMDIVLAPRRGQPLLLRNNRDGTFTPRPIFPGVEAARGFAWADIDNDGAPDAALLDAEGKLHVFMNERSGTFLPPGWHRGNGCQPPLPASYQHGDLLGRPAVRPRPGCRGLCAVVRKARAG